MPDDDPDTTGAAPGDGSGRDDDPSADATGGDGAPPPLARGALDPRDRILAATVELIGEQGWGRVTTRKVAERAGVNNALLHYYFGSKQALLVQAATEALVGTFASPLELLDAGKDLRAGAQASLAWLGEVDPDLPQARVFAEISVQAIRDPALRETFRTMLREARAAVAARARAQGYGTERAEGLAVLLLALLDGALFHRLVDPGFDVANAVDALAALFEEEESA